MELYGKFPYVYIRDTKYGWVPAEIIKNHFGDDDDVTDRKITEVSVRPLKPSNWDESTHFEECEAYPFGQTPLVRVDMTHPANTKLPVQNVDDRGDVVHAADLANLGFTHEAAVLYSLKERHYLRMPYSRVNGILVAMNPFQWIDDLYSPEKFRQYFDSIIRRSNNDLSAEERNDTINNKFVVGTKNEAAIEPHIFEISCLAYKGLVFTGKDQSILVSGVSGSGKTESVKILMKNLASLSSSNRSDCASESITSKILQSSFILEAFGNAQTTRSENSSRFSKFVQLQFNAVESNASGETIFREIISSNSQAYVLEKSRVLNNDRKERNFHIFYQLLAADDQFKMSIWEGLKDSDCRSFKYIGACDRNKINGKTDSDHLKDTIRALTTIGLSDEQRKTIFRAVSIVLQLGNVRFQEDPIDSEKSVVDSPAELIKLSEIMGIRKEEIESSLISRQVIIGVETFTLPLKVDDARSSRDTLAKSIYSFVFDYLVETLNNETGARCAPEAGWRIGNINLLDICGFESEEMCQFEQLCINYANEKLQIKYIQDNFDAVLEEFASEGIHVVGLPRTHQLQVLELLERKEGLINILNEECVRPFATADSFVTKLKRINRGDPCLVQEKLALPNEFGIRHYATVLTYDAKDFIIRNKDAIADDLVKCASKCSNGIISSQSKKLIVERKESSKFKDQQRGWHVSTTILGAFQKKLRTLIETIEGTGTHYVRCIKPNNDMRPRRTDQNTTLEQVRNAGLVEALSVSRYHREFFSAATAVLRRFFLSLVLRLRFLATRKAAIRMQAFARGRKQIVLYLKVLRACTSIQNIYRLHRAKSVLSNLKMNRVATAVLSRFFWSLVSRLRFLATQRAAIRVQAFARGRKQIILYRKVLKTCASIQNIYRSHRAKTVLSNLKMNRVALEVKEKKLALLLQPEKSFNGEREHLDAARAKPTEAFLYLDNENYDHRELHNFSDAAYGGGDLQFIGVAMNSNSAIELLLKCNHTKDLLIANQFAISN